MTQLDSGETDSGETLGGETGWQNVADGSSSGSWNILGLDQFNFLQR